MLCFRRRLRFSIGYNNIFFFGCAGDTSSFFDLLVKIIQKRTLIIIIIIIIIASYLAFRASIAKEGYKMRSRSVFVAPEDEASSF